VALEALGLREQLRVARVVVAGAAQLRLLLQRRLRRRRPFRLTRIRMAFPMRKREGVEPTRRKRIRTATD